MCKCITYLLSCTFSRIWRINGPVFAFDTVCLSITHSLRVNPYICYGEIWPQETRNISRSYMVQNIACLDILNRVGVTDSRRTDGQTRSSHMPRCTTLCGQRYTSKIWRFPLHETWVPKTAALRRQGLSAIILRTNQTEKFKPLTILSTFAESW